MDMENTV